MKCKELFFVKAGRVSIKHFTNDFIFLLPAAGTLFDILASHSCTSTKNQPFFVFNLKPFLGFEVTEH